MRSPTEGDHLAAKAPPAVWAGEGLPSWSLPPLGLVSFSLNRECSPCPGLEEERRRRGSPGLQQPLAPGREVWAGGARLYPQRAGAQAPECGSGCDWLCVLEEASHLLWAFTSSLGKWDVATPSRDKTWVGR